MSERAFPVENPRVTEQRGMTLRDYFAAHALAGVVQYSPYAGAGAQAKLAYEIADAMIEQRYRASIGV